MYLTPVVYPKPHNGLMGMIMKINPMATVIPITRDWLTGQEVVQSIPFWIILGIFLFVTLFGFLIYRITLSLIIERIGN